MISAWMLYGAGAAALLAAAGGVVERALERLARPTRWVWAAALLASVAVPCAAIMAGLLPRGAEVEVPAAPGEEMPILPVREVATPAAAPRWGPDAVLLAAWALGTAALSLGLALSACSLARSRRGWRRAEVEGTPLWVSEETGPAVVGFLRPAIVLPEWALRGDPAIRRLVVAHEREHLRAGDSRLLLAALLLVAALPWNPALWWQLRRLRQAMETDCDRRVLAREPDVRRYGMLLLEVAERVRRPVLPVAAFAESRSFLERRIRMMTTRQARNRVGWTLASLTAALAAPALLFALPTPAPLRLEGVRTMVEPWLPLRPARAPEERPAPAPRQPAPPRDTIPERAYEVSVLDQAPRLINVLEVQRTLSQLYNTAMATRRPAAGEGTTMMQFVIEADGSVDPATIKVVSSTRPEFNDASEKAVATFRFRPGIKDGRAVRTLIQMPIAWKPDITAEATSGPPVPPAPADADRPGFAYEVAVLDSPPKLMDIEQVKNTLQQLYPQMLKAAGIEGTTMMQFVIQADGSVDPATIKVISSTRPEFAAASEKALESFRFRPGMKDGKAVRTLIQMPIVWKPPVPAQQ